MHSLPCYAFYSIAYPQVPRKNKQEPSKHPKQSPTFPFLNNGPLAVHISDETGVATKGIIPFPNRESCFRFLKHKQILTYLQDIMVARFQYFLNSLVEALVGKKISSTICVSSLIITSLALQDNAAKGRPFSRFRK